MRTLLPEDAVIRVAFGIARTTQAVERKVKTLRGIEARRNEDRAFEPRADFGWRAVEAARFSGSEATAMYA